MYLPTLPYLMSSTSKKQRKFQFSISCEFLVLLLEHIRNPQASKQPEQLKLMMNNSLPNPFPPSNIPHEYLQVFLRKKNKKAEEERNLRKHT